MRTFSYWKRLFESNDLLDFTRMGEGLLWLKLRSIDRKDLLAEFCADIGFDLGNRPTAELIWQRKASCVEFEGWIDGFMRKCQKRENGKIDASIEEIRSNLYKMTHFHWGGGFRNSLDKAIVSRYVKTASIISYDQLAIICDGELKDMSGGYLRNSWYNYWSSVLIENLFRRNKRVLPAYGKIKNVDFFIDGFPFDLKVTYMPREYVSAARKHLGVAEPLTVLKRYARKNGIRFNPADTPEQIRYEVSERMKDSSDPDAMAVLSSIDADWKRTVDDVISRKRELIRWLYENQGDMRFGAENRVYLVLADMDNPDESWKLKRNVDMIAPKIANWVSDFKRENAADMLTTFTFKSKRYNAYADVIFAVKQQQKTKQQHTN
jgi:hypothetical protein